MNFAADVVEEIALEGLDGITCNALWVRLDSRKEFSLKLDPKSKEFIWKNVGVNPNLEFYVMPEAREDLLPYDRFAFKDPTTGIWVHNVAEQNIYPLKVIENEPGLQGSCFYYDARQSVTTQVRSLENKKVLMSLEEIIIKWGQKFVLVANQKTRYDALVHERDPRIELTHMMYCVLERVGRMRYSGETSHALSKIFFNNIPSQIYYLCKKLQEFGYITKQQFLTQVENHKNLNVRLIHLKHFYAPIKNKYAQLMERVSVYLEDKPNNTEVYNVFKADMGFMKKSFKSLLTSYPKYIKTCVKKYTDVRPNATPKEYLCKTGNDKEKQLRVITLLQPFRVSVDDIADSDNSDSDEDDTEMTPMEWEFGKTMLHQCQTGLETGGSTGLSQSQFGVVMGFTRLEARSVLRKMTRLDMCHTYKMDCGRQRKNIFVSARLYKNSEVLKEYEAEQSALQKNMTLIGEPNDTATESQDETGDSDSPQKRADNSGYSTLDEVQKRKLKWLTNPFERKTSSRLLRRTNWILESVQESRVIENEFHILKEIWQRESAQGIQEKMDKRSLKRILHWLQQEGRIQLLKSVIYKEGQAIDLTIICLPEIVPSDPAVKLAIEQAKLRLIGVRKESMEQINKKGEEPKAPSPPTIHSIPSVTESIQRFQEYRNRFKSNTPMVYDMQSWRRYGLVPKFKRYQLVHEMLFYLLYNYQGQVPETGSVDTTDQHSIDFTWHLDTHSKENLDEEAINVMLEEMKEPPVYHDDLSWKRYLAPVPKHIGILDMSEGWCLISDVLILLPLTVVCQIVNIPYKIDGLEKLLSDPKKRLYPITYLPYHITNQLLYARRYVYSFYESCVHLSKMGLLSFGPQIRKAKEKAFINLHRKAVLRDTRRSLPGYMKTVLPDDLTEFPVRLFDFQSTTDVELYWCDLLMIVLDTNLNCKGIGRKDEDEESVEAVEMTLEDSSRIKQFKDLPFDPVLPGDHRGAGGFDASLFIHLMRNWFRISDIKKVTSENEEDCLVPDPNLIQYARVAEKLGSKKTTKKDNLPSTSKQDCKNDGKKRKGNKGGKGVKRLNKRKRVVEKVKGPPKKKVRKTYYDERDFIALGLMTKERVVWTSKEDGILLLCKVASYLMGGDRKGLIVPWTVVRDILHEKSKETSYDKSSKACQRRVAFALRHPVSKMNVSLFLSQTKQDKEIMKKYGNEKSHLSENTLVPLFKNLVFDLIEKFKAHEDPDMTKFPSTVEDLNTNYDLTKITSEDYWRDNEVTDIQSDKDICFNVLYDLIHSFVVTSKDKQGRSHEMYRIFNQYPDFLLTEVFTRMKDDGIITKIKKVSKPLMYGVNHHQLAQRYKFRFLNRFPDNMFNECNEFLERLWQKYVESDGLEGIDIKIIDGGGTCAAILSLSSLQKVFVKLKMPKEILVLDRAGCSLPVSRGRIQKALTETDDEDDDDDDDDLLDTAKTRKLTKGKTLKAKKKEENLVQHIIDIGHAEDTDLSEDDTEGHRSKDQQEGSIGTEEIGESSKTQTKETESAVSIISNDASPSMTEVEFEFRKKVKMPVSDKQLPKSLSRALLALARNQSFQKMPDKNFNVQDNILIQTCDIEAFLMPTPRRSGNSFFSTSSGNTAISSLFLSPEKFREILKKQQKLYPFELNMDVQWKQFSENYDESYVEDLKSIYDFVNTHGVLGVPLFDLQEKIFEMVNYKNKLQTLVEANSLLPVGIYTRRYVCFPHARPWLIHSYKNTKGRSTRLSQSNNQDSDINPSQDAIILMEPKVEDEDDPSATATKHGEEVPENPTAAPEQSLDTARPTEQSSLDQQDSSKNSENTSQVIQPNSERVAASEEQAGNVRNIPSSDQSEEPVVPDQPLSTEAPEKDAHSRSSKRPLDTPEQPTRSSKRRRTNRRDDTEESSGPPAISTYEKVRLICRPWRKPEGHLNRGVFSSMLEGVLLFIMASPSCQRKAVEDKFDPYLKPVATQELLEILEDLGCVIKIICRRRTQKPSLFSKPEVSSIVTDEKRNDEVLYETTQDCCLKFGQFSFFLSTIN